VIKFYAYLDISLLLLLLMLTLTLAIAADEGRSVPDVDLNCRENVSLTSDSDEHSDDGTIENKVFPQQRFSPVATPKHSATFRPRPVRFDSGMDAAAAPVVRPSSSTPAFHPNGDVFKARASQTQNSSGKPDTCRAMCDGIFSGTSQIIAASRLLNGISNCCFSLQANSICC